MNKMVLQALIAAVVLMSAGWLLMGEESKPQTVTLASEVLLEEVNVNENALPVEEVSVIHEPEEAIEGKPVEMQ